MVIPSSMNRSTPFPFDIREVDSKLSSVLQQHFKGSSKFVQVGPEGYFFPSKFESEAEKVYNFPVRSDDVWVVTFPRSGTTWTQEMVWLIGNRLNYDEALRIPLKTRFPFLEYSIFADDAKLSEFVEVNKDNPAHLEIIQDMATPQYECLKTHQGRRFIKTHLPFSLLPPDLLTSGAKIIYVARNPKDVAVSYYHLYKLFRTLDFTSNFETFWGYFENNLVGWAPYWSHVKEGWKHKNSPNVLFLFYEDLQKNLNGSITKVAQFMDISLTKDQTEELVDHLDIKNFRVNPSVNSAELKEVGICRSQEAMFIRDGKSGSWKTQFSASLGARANAWIESNMQDTDIKFPE